MTRPPLVRPRQGSVLAGVCAGVAAHLGLTLGVVRAVMLGLACAGGFGALLYAWLWATVPAEDTWAAPPMRAALTPPAVPDPVPDPALTAETAANLGTVPTAPSRRHWPIAELLFGAALLVVGIGLVLDRLGVSVNLTVVLPTLAVFAGVGLAWWLIADRRRPDRYQLPRVLGALVLVAVGVLMFFITARQPSVWTVIAAALAVLLGVALAIAPWLLRINRDLIAERAAGARAAERADIAAHLHDSVLQSLALIQQRSQPSSEVARIARRQERELRDWLFRGADGGTESTQESVEKELRDQAVRLEADYAVEFDVVSVGQTDTMPEAIVAAAREAMLNAAQHAGGRVTVYLEAARDRVSIDVTDRGPGVDVHQLREGRMGVRESILGRMERAGGEATIKPGPGGAGTTVRLVLRMQSTPAPQTEAHGGEGEQHE